jgi:hypothetical protein
MSLSHSPDYIPINQAFEQLCAELIKCTLINDELPEVPEVDFTTTESIVFDPAYDDYGDAEWKLAKRMCIGIIKLVLRLYRENNGIYEIIVIDPKEWDWWYVYGSDRPPGPIGTVFEARDREDHLQLVKISEFGEWKISEFGGGLAAAGNAPSFISEPIAEPALRPDVHAAQSDSSEPSAAQPSAGWIAHFAEPAQQPPPGNGMTSEPRAAQPTIDAADIEMSGGARPPGRPLTLREEIKDKMKADLHSGEITKDELQNMFQKTLAGRYGAHRQTVCKAREAVLSERAGN